MFPRRLLVLTMFFSGTSAFYAGGRGDFTMTVFEKLNLKNQADIVVLNPPASFEGELAALHGVNIARSLENAGDVSFLLAFVITEQDLSLVMNAALRKAKGDVTVWFAYPKGSSKRYKSEINRDHGWQVLGKAGFEPVRSVAIDEDWSGMRFRRVEFIKSMTRDPKSRMSAEGKARKK